MFQNFTITKNYTLTSVIYDIACSMENLYVSIANQIRQYTFESFTLAYNFYLSGSNNNCTLLID